MTFRRVAQIVGLGCVYALGLLTMVGTGTNNPVTPTNAALQIPSTTPGMWQDVSPQQDGTFTVLPFATSVPMVRVTFSAPSPSSLHVTAQDTVGNGPVVEIPEVSQSTSMPTGFHIDGVDTKPNPAQWTVTIKLPPVFQNSLQFAINISEVGIRRLGKRAAEIIACPPRLQIERRFARWRTRHQQPARNQLRRRGTGLSIQVRRSGSRIWCNDNGRAERGLVSNAHLFGLVGRLLGGELELGDNRLHLHAHDGRHQGSDGDSELRRPSASSTASDMSSDHL